MTKTVDLETSQGTIRLELDDEKAPITVKNFITNVENGHFDGTVFHRVIKGFMVQGGGFEPGMQQKPTGNSIQNEASNGLKNDKYTVAMARTSAPHSATAQFFINAADNEFLNFKSETASGWQKSPHPTLSPTSGLGAARASSRHVMHGACCVWSIGSCHTTPEYATG